MVQWVEFHPLSISSIGSTTKSITNLKRPPVCPYGGTISWTNNLSRRRDYTISMSARTNLCDYYPHYVSHNRPARYKFRAVLIGNLFQLHRPRVNISTALFGHYWIIISLFQFPYYFIFV